MDKGRDEHRSQEEDEDEDEYTDEHTITFKERKSKYGRRTQVEVLLGFVVHLLMLFYWVFVHVYDASVVKSLSEDARRVAFPTHDQFLGRWRFLTYINMWMCLGYYFLAFFTDIMPRSYLKGVFQDIVDFAFTALIFPMSLFVAVAFWGVYAVDREGIYPLILDSLLPSLLNHVWHSFIVVCVILEMLLVFHPYPTALRAIISMFVINIIYSIMVVYLRQATGKWAYSFLHSFPPPLVPVFFASSYVTTIIFYYIGKTLAYLRWGDRITANIKGEVKQD
ncbi:androgen-dependent TFPI-regulating protein-like [Dysidea avara]|uniref:androgen-dependent TFPI-regulating protein-like n=1 Tax=Dysidea avara TaxID=196820 RepID=UPI003332AF6A